MPSYIAIIPLQPAATDEDSVYRIRYNPPSEFKKERKKERKTNINIHLEKEKKRMRTKKKMKHKKMKKPIFQSLILHVDVFIVSLSARNEKRKRPSYDQPRQIPTAAGLGASSLG